MLRKKRRQWLSDLRLKQGLSTYQAAEKVGLSQSYYVQIETGMKGHMLPVETAMKIADGLGFDWKLFYVNCIPTQH